MHILGPWEGYSVVVIEKAAFWREHMPVGKVLQSTTTYYSSTTQYYSNTILYYNALLQYHSVLQSTAPVLPCTTKYYSSTTLFYKVLHYSTTTKYYSSTSLYMSLLQRTTPVLALYYKIQLQYYSVLQSSTHDWNVIYNIRNNKRPPPTSPNTTPAMKNESQDWSCSHMKRHLPCATQQKAASKILPLPRKMNLMIDPSHIWNVIYNARCNKCQPPTSPNTAPATQNESHDWSVSHMTFHLSIDPAHIWNAFTMRDATKGSLPLHKILRLPRKMNLMIDPSHIWNVIYNARCNKSQPPTPPNTAPATKNESQDWSCSHLKRHLPCVEQRRSPSNLTK